MIRKLPLNFISTSTLLKWCKTYVFALSVLFSVWIISPRGLLNMKTGVCKDTRNCQEKVNKISHLKPNQLAPSIYIMKELCFFSLDQWEISIHLLWGKCFNIPHHCDPHLNQTKLNGLLPLTIPGVLVNNIYAFYPTHTTFIHLPIPYLFFYRYHIFFFFPCHIYSFTHTI